MIYAFSPKAVADVLDYKFDFTTWLPTGDTVSTAAFDVSPAGLVLGSIDHTSTSASAVLSGGQTRTEYVLGCTIVTQQGRTVRKVAALFVE